MFGVVPCSLSLQGSVTRSLSHTHNLYISLSNLLLYQVSVWRSALPLALVL
jgi:hypothetical protein